MNEEFVTVPKSWGDGVPGYTQPTITNPHKPDMPGVAPIVPTDAANKAYVDETISHYLSIAPPYDLTGYINKSTPAAMTGPLILASVARDNVLDLIPKSEVDPLFNVENLVIGDIVRFPVVGSYTGMLQCNGAVLSQASYPALYAIIGSTFNTGVTRDIGQPWARQPTINTTQIADIGTWTAGTPMPSPTGSGNGVFVTKNRVYSVGGYQGQNTVYTAPIDSGGILGAWTTDTAFPVPIYFTQAFITRSRVYIVGGDNGSGVAYSSVYYAIINNDGTIGTWTLDTAFPATISWHSYIITSTMVYTIGGIVNGAQSLAIYSAPLNSDGSIGTWALVGSFPIAITQTQIIQTYNRVYSCGGTVSNAGIATVYTAPINNNGTLGPWVQGTNLPNNYWFSMAVNTKSRAWIISGNVGTLSTTSVITAPINTDGTLGVWAAGTSTPITIQIAQCIITSTRIYSIGKYWSANVYYAAFTGGSNDYVTNMFVPTINTSTQFTLPDFTTVDAVSGGLTTYIKF